MTSRRLLLVLPLLSVGCGPALPGDTPPARFATTLEQASSSSAIVVARMDAFETMARREVDAIAYANGDRRVMPRVGPPEAGIAAQAGDVIGAAFVALGDYGHILTTVATDQPPIPRQSDSGTVLAQQASQGLVRLRQSAGIVLPSAVQAAGLNGIATLAALPDRVAAGPRRSTQSLVAEAEPSVKAVAELLRTLIDNPSGGLRGVLRAKREGFDSEASRFLNRLAVDRRLGPADRYMLYRSVAALREDDPASGTFAAIASVATSMQQAHTALAGPTGPAQAAVSGFEASVAQLGVLAESSRRRDPPPPANDQPLR